jgi:two-component system response regulator HydG
MESPRVRTMEDTRILGAPGQLASLDSIITQDAKMLACIDQAMNAAKADVSVMILGETGTGKNLLAEVIHKAGCRCAGPCVVLNCSALPENLLETEIFGHVQGAYTGAHKDRRGRFEMAHGGTLVLDEIGELSSSAQVKLLRAVETKQFERVGGEESVHVDVRVVSLTNANIHELVSAKKFREDLLYRLQDVSITLPPLRERRGDIPLLVKAFVAHYSERFGKKVQGVSDVAMNFIMAHSWPGNVRELQAVIKRGVVTAKGDQLWLEDLALQVLKLTAGNKRKTAELLKISRTTLDSKLKAYNIVATE